MVDSYRHIKDVARHEALVKGVEQYLIVRGFNQESLERGWDRIHLSNGPQRQIVFED